MARFESFKPRLKYGRIIPQGEKLLFETDRPFDQIILPIEIADFLLLCNGAHTVSEIIESVYYNKGSIQFKSIYKTLLYLKDRNFLENGDELEVINPVEEKNDFQFVTFKPFFEMPIGKRIFNDQVRPGLFYVLSMLTILAAIYSIQFVKSNWLELSFLRVSDSYTFGLLFLFVSTSVLLTLKGIFKCVLLVFLTGRAYNFNFTFNGFALYFRVRSDSLFLTTNKLYLLLFHLAVTLCYLPIAASLHFISPSSPFVNDIMGVSFLLFLLDLNPYQESESNFFLKTLFNDDSINRMLSYLKNNSALTLINPLERRLDRKVLVSFSLFSLTWSFITFTILLNSLGAHNSYFISTIRHSSILEKIAAIMAMAFIGILASVVVFNTIKVSYYSIIIPFTQVLKIKFQKLKSKRIKHFDSSQLLKILEQLPLFNYFSTELLGMIISKSEVRAYKNGSTVIQRGDDANHLFVLLSGFLKVVGASRGQNNQNSSEIAQIHPPSIFGEVAVVPGSKRTATVTAVSHSLVLEVPAEMLRQISEHSQYIRELNGFQNAIMVNQFFSSAPVFREIPESIIHLFTVKGKIENFIAQQPVFKQGDTDDGFYLILRGSVGVKVNDQQIACIQQGGFFGETSMITDVPRTATVYAITPLTTLKINRDAFWEILAHDINMAMFIESVGEMRIREDIEILRANRAKIA